MAHWIVLGLFLAMGESLPSWWRMDFWGHMILQNWENLLLAIFHILPDVKTFRHLSYPKIWNYFMLTWHFIVCWIVFKYFNICLLSYSDECVSNPCLNQGTCLNLIGRFQCICTEEFLGSTCAIPRGIHISINQSSNQACLRPDSFNNRLIINSSKITAHHSNLS